MRLKNNLWKPAISEQITQQEKRKPPQDDICLTCPNYKDDHCRGLCPPLQWINGRQETKEIIPSKPIIVQGIELIDYNTALHEMIEDKQATDIDKLDSIRSIKEYKLRMIAACILAYIPQAEIAKLAHISQSRISRLYRIVK
jgi:hypothetical protein